MSAIWTDNKQISESRRKEKNESRKRDLCMQIYVFVHPPTSQNMHREIYFYVQKVKHIPKVSKKPKISIFFKHSHGRPVLGNKYSLIMLRKEGIMRRGQSPGCWFMGLLGAFPCWFTECQGNTLEEAWSFVQEIVTALTLSHGAER